MMDNNVWAFIGVSKTIRTEADTLITTLYENFFRSVALFSELQYSDYSSINDLIKDGIKGPKEYKYFWEWLEEFGLPRLKEIAQIPLTDSDEVLDLLDFRIYALKEVCNNGIPDAIIASLADAIGVIYDSCQQSCATKSEEDGFNIILGCDWLGEISSLTSSLKNSELSFYTMPL